jgi:ADP-ribose pyrophosphatase YjhB (NUDIX family)
MSERRTRKSPNTIDLVLFTALKDQLAVLLWRTPDGREKWALPWEQPTSDETLDDSAGRIAGEALGAPPAWLEQLGAFGSEKRHPSESEISVAFVGLAPAGTPPPVGGAYAWFPAGELPALAARQRTMLDGAISMLRVRMDQSPVAFRLLPPTFTLSELQHMYELLLGKRLHKASFRRALQAAWLVEPTEEWRSEGRGRPAQLFRYAPRKRRPAQRGIRLDMLTS